MGEWELNLKGSLVQEKEGLFTDECCSAWPAEVKTWSLSSTLSMTLHRANEPVHAHTLSTCTHSSASNEVWRNHTAWENLDRLRQTAAPNFSDDLFDFKRKIIKETEGHWETYIETVACQAWRFLTEWTAQAHLTEYMTITFHYNSIKYEILKSV